MFRSLLVSALGAGLAAGVLAALLQFWLLVPLIAEAERYESGELVHFGAASGVQPGHDDGAATDGDGHGHGAAVASGGFARHGLTLLFTLATYAGYGLLLVAGFALARRLGLVGVTPRQGLMWGLAGFVAVTLMPALGLPPELPGSGAAALSARQLWWVATVLCTAGGLAVLAAAPGALRLAGPVLILAPHVVGAPHPEGFTGVAPPELAALFAARALGVGALAWAVLGWSASVLWRRQTES